MYHKKITTNLLLHLRLQKKNLKKSAATRCPASVSETLCACFFLIQEANDPKKVLSLSISLSPSLQHNSEPTNISSKSLFQGHSFCGDGKAW
jgi:hypothetical protein